MTTPTGGGIAVSYEALDTASIDMRNGAGRLDTTLTELESKLNGLRADWDGEAKDSYDIAQRNWDNAVLEIKQLLESIAQTVTNSNDAYTQVETSAKNAWVSN